MSLRINDIAPDFGADTTHGRIRFHPWIVDSRAAWSRDLEATQGAKVISP